MRNLHSGAAEIRIHQFAAIYQLAERSLGLSLGRAFSLHGVADVLGLQLLFPLVLLYQFVDFFLQFSSVHIHRLPLGRSDRHKNRPRSLTGAGMKLYHYSHLKVGVILNVSRAKVKSSMCIWVKAIPVILKNRSQPMRSIHSPTRSCLRASLA